MADLKKQKEEQEAKQKKMFGRPVTDREPLSNFRCGKWRKVLAEREEKTGKAPTFRFSSRAKIHEIMLDHEKKNRVTRSRDIRGWNTWLSLFTRQPESQHMAPEPLLNTCVN